MSSSSIIALLPCHRHAVQMNGRVEVFLKRKHENDGAILVYSERHPTGKPIKGQEEWVVPVLRERKGRKPAAPALQEVP